MYLKKLEIKGFKSFPDKTEILFPQGLISVVGPNGSGKSNILDAIRWVLGEQSMKSLRGDKLEDVIFSGTQRRKESTQCEVSLLIDNSDGRIDIDYTEIGIKRKAFKSGESQFFINNKPCRLKDIKELLLDTGIGREGYSIISQGKIDEILDGSSQYRRKIIEDAAGITKSRYKKDEGQKKLEATKENLERINDIYFEIEKQVKPLEEQKNKAEIYLSLRKELIRSDGSRLLKEYQTAEEFKNNIHKEFEKIQKSIEEISEKKAITIEKQQQLIQEKENLTAEQEVTQNIIKGLEQEKNQKSQSLAVTMERTSNLNQQLERLDLIGKENREELSLQDKKILEKQAQIHKQKLELEQVNTTHQKEAQNYEEVKSKLEELEEKTEEWKSLLLQDMNDLSGLRSKQELMERSHEEQKQRMEDFRKEHQILQSKDLELDSVKQQQQSQLEQKESSQDQMIKEKNNLQEKIKELEAQIVQSQRALLDIENSEKEILSKRSLLQKMEQDMEGLARGTKALLSQRPHEGIYDVVANAIKVKPGYEKAIEAALGGSIHHMIVSNAESAKACIEYLKKNKLGRVTFLPRDTIKGRKSSYQEGQSALEGVVYPLEIHNILEYLLGQVMILPDMDAAIAISKKYKNTFKIVTMDGEIFNPGGSITGGSTSGPVNIFSRRKIIEDYGEFLEKSEENKKKVQEEITEQQENKTQTLDKVNKLNEAYQNLQSELAESKNLLLTTSLEIKHLQSQMERHEQMMNSNANQEENLNKTRKEQDSKMVILEKQIESAKIEIKNLTRMIQELEETGKKSDDALRKYEVEQARRAEELKALHMEEQELTIINRRLNQMTKSNQQEFENTGSEITALNQKMTQYQEEISYIEQTMQAATTQLRKVLEKQNPVMEAIKSNSMEVTDLEKKLLQEENKKVKVDADQGRYHYQQEIILEKLQDDYGLTLEEAQSIEDKQADTSRRHIDTLKSEITAMGNVNLDSIAEYQKISERYELYKTQKMDLEEAMAKLETIIRSLEKNMVIEFKKSFLEINERFQEVFRVLFGGGHGELILTNQEDLLGSDIDVNVQPPGKKLKSISVLSGGEKALSAIAILFAILLRRPVPFCILDEIDAPLDDANIFRFVKFLEELTHDTQFLTITHRRGTMEASDYIYGVTMQESGVSKIVSIMLEDAKHYIEN